MATLSVERAHASLAEVAVTLVTVIAPGCVGATVSAADAAEGPTSARTNVVRDTRVIPDSLRAIRPCFGRTLSIVLMRFPLALASSESPCGWRAPRRGRIDPATKERPPPPWSLAACGSRGVPAPAIRGAGAP